MNIIPNKKKYELITVFAALLLALLTAMLTNRTECRYLSKIEGNLNFKIEKFQRISGEIDQNGNLNLSGQGKANIYFIIPSSLENNFTVSMGDESLTLGYDSIVIDTVVYYEYAKGDSTRKVCRILDGNMEKIFLPGDVLTLTANDSQENFIPEIQLVVVPVSAKEVLSNE